MAETTDDPASTDPSENDETPRPVLLRARSGWVPPEGFEITYQVGQFIKGHASKAAYEALAEDRDVISYETDLTTGRFT